MSICNFGLYLHGDEYEKSYTKVKHHFQFKIIITNIVHNC